MKSPAEITYSGGKVVPNPVVCIWEDNHTERRGNWFRAFWCASPDAPTGSPVIGYCSPGGSQRTIRAAVSEVRRLYPEARCYRNGKEIYPGRPAVADYLAWAKSQAEPEPALSKAFCVASRSSNVNAFGLHGLILVARNGEAWEVARYLYSDEFAFFEKGSVRTFPLVNGAPVFVGCEIPRRLPDAPANVVAEVWGGSK